MMVALLLEKKRYKKLEKKNYNFMTTTDLIILIILGSILECLAILFTIRQFKKLIKLHKQEKQDRENDF